MCIRSLEKGSYIFVAFWKDEVDFVKLNLSKQQRFEMYMSALLAPLHPVAKSKESERSSLTWLNVLIGRLFFDFLIEDVWAQLVSEKIQKKLNRIKVSPLQDVREHIKMENHF